MKKKRIHKLIPGLLLLLGMTSCLGIICVNGNGIIESEERSESGFHGIENTTSANVHFTSADEYSLIVEADENILPYIRTSVSSGILLIDISGARCIRPDRTPFVYVSGPDMSELYSGGSGDMFADVLAGTEIKIFDSGSGNIIVNYSESADIEVKNSGSGNITVRDMFSEEARIRISGSGDINAEGNVSALSIASSGSGIFIGDDLESQICNALLSGSGNVFVNVSDELIATLTGSGNLYYEGDPQIYDNITGSGRIIDLNK